MKAVIQRVSSAHVEIEGKTVAKIKKGLVLLVGYAEEDFQSDIDWIVSKTVNMRIFSDENDLMNLSIKDIEGQILIISQFTLFAKTKKGNRPSFIHAAKPLIAVPLYNATIDTFQKNVTATVETGEFGKNMQVHLVNDGPVTIQIDSKLKI